jgi:hypothetical protein
MFVPLAIEPVEPPVELEESIEPVESIEGLESVESMEPVEPEPTEVVEAVEPELVEESVEPELVESIEPVEPIEPLEPIEPVVFGGHAGFMMLIAHSRSSWQIPIAPSFNSHDSPQTQASKEEALRSSESSVKEVLCSSRSCSSLK